MIAINNKIECFKAVSKLSCPDTVHPKPVTSIHIFYVINPNAS